MPKIIAVFADGTGNSSSQVFRTNVWRLYEALDTTGPIPQGGVEQVAYYHNGVGTSSFRPLAIFGGAFGWGLKRNIIDLYTFICRAYKPGDHLYLFGFSRGAYTVRVLAGFLIGQGLVQDTGRSELQAYARDAYRQYRRRFNPTGGLVKPLRNLRDAFINWSRRRTGWKTYLERRADPTVGNRESPVAFVGVWDTVAAYGTPIAELTRGIDDWVWPLSMPNYELSKRVWRARHALALDDERETFHPLLWDERHESGEADRLKQVWFAGMHSDVGGGYPDDSLSHVALDWMLTEAEAPDAAHDVPGLRFRAKSRREIAETKDPCGPIHDSRRGLGGYYRYQPRKLAARLDPPDPTTLLMQDPDTKSKNIARLKRVVIHESVFERILHGTDRYAPVGLPPRCDVTSGGTPEPSPGARVGQQETVWDWVWHKRVNYFMTVGVSIVLASLPLWQLYSRPAACVGPQCLLSPIIEAAGEFLPGLAQPWISAFARTPGLFALLLSLLASLLMRSDSLQTTIRDSMRALWMRSTQAPPPEPKLSQSGTWVRKLRSAYAYQRVFQSLKWTILPSVFGVALLFLAIAVTAVCAGFGIVRTGIWQAEFRNVDCSPEVTKPPFKTSSPCWTLGQSVVEGERYRVTLDIDAGTPWRDLTIDTSPRGFGAADMTLVGNLFTPVRRSLNGRWFQPMIKIVPERGRFQVVPLEMTESAGAPTRYTAQMMAPRSGQVFMFVNDVLLPTWAPGRLALYANNHGDAASVRIERVEVPSPIARPGI
jgi:uncharacterized protein (DUF2235 family)